MHIKTHIFCFLAGLLFIVDLVHANEVALPYKGITLNANLELAAGKKLDDGVILITHGALAYNGMEIIVYLRKLFKERGYNTLAINLSLGINNRHGMYDCKVTHRHRQNDAIGEIDAWIEWLKGQGVKQVTLLGHSRGGLQTALYAAERDNALVKAVVLMAPATRDNGGPGYQKRYKKPLAPILEQAQKLIKEGKGDTVLKHVDFMSCLDTSVTADAFVSYYGPDPRLDAPYLIPGIKKPTLVVVAGNDEVVVGLDKKVAPLVDGKHVQMKVIDGAGHFFRDLNADDAVDAIDGFLKEIGG